MSRPSLDVIKMFIRLFVKCPKLGIVPLAKLNVSFPSFYWNAAIAICRKGMNDVALLIHRIIFHVLVD
jgi:hypothetical protein